jgi:hypothetical protein
MYMRITRGHFDPVNLAAIEALGPDVNALLKALPGCRAVYQAADRTRGTTVAVTLWDSEKHANFTRDSLGPLVARMQAAGLRMDQPEVFEVIEAVAPV